MPAPPPAMRFVAADGLDFPLLDAMVGQDLTLDRCLK